MAPDKKYRSFVELWPFHHAWFKSLALTEDDLEELQDVLLENPTIHPVMAGTGGIRKLRFAPARWHTGKRGAVRICYVYFQHHNTIVLVTAYPKNEKVDLSADERRSLREAVDRLDRAMTLSRKKN